MTKLLTVLATTVIATSPIMADGGNKGGDRDNRSNLSQETSKLLDEQKKNGNSSDREQGQSSSENSESSHQDESESSDREQGKSSSENSERSHQDEFNSMDNRSDKEMLDKSNHDGSDKNSKMRLMNSHKINFKTSLKKALSEAQHQESAKRVSKSIDKNMDIEMNMEIYMHSGVQNASEMIDFALTNPNTSKVIDDKGNLTHLVIDLENGTTLEANATYDSNDRFTYGKLAQGNYWIEESVVFGDVNVVSTVKDSEGLLILTESPVAFAENSIEKFNSDGLPIMISEYVGDEVVFQVETKYDDQNRTIYKKMSSKDSQNETTISYDEDGTVNQTFAGSFSHKADKKSEAINVQEDINADGQTVIQHVGNDSGNIYFEEVFNDGSNSYHKFTDETGYWTENRTEMDNDSQMIKISTLDSNGVKTTETIPLSNRFGDDMKMGDHDIEDRDSFERGDEERKDRYNSDDRFDKRDNGENGSYQTVSTSNTSYPTVDMVDGSTPPAISTGEASITSDFISDLPTGWNLIGSSADVDLELLRTMKSVFKYDAYTQNWEYIQFDKNGNIANEDGNLQINPFDGFWINK